jgi:hypothetical protein
MTRETLFSLLAKSGVHEVTIAGVTGILQAVEREDGSGKCFNVVMLTKGGRKTVFVRCVNGSLAGSITGRVA